MHAKHQVFFVQGAGAGTHDEWDIKLVESLRRELGPGYEVHYPRMPDEADPHPLSWKRAMVSELAGLPGQVSLVGHSVGGSLLLKALVEEDIKNPVAGLFLLAAPAWDEEQWDFDDLKLPPDTAERLAGIPRIFLYHSRDDDVVPFAHLALHGARLPRAILRPVEGRGHQLGNDLADVAQDLRLGGEA